MRAKIRENDQWIGALIDMDVTDGSNTVHGPDTIVFSDFRVTENSGNAFVSTITPCGMWSDNTNLQLVANTHVAQVITFDTLEVDHSGISLVANTKFTVSKVGNYSVSLSAMCTLDSGPTGYIDMWVRKNGNITIPRSNTRVTVKNKEFAILAVTFVFEATAINDYFEILMCGSSTGVGIGTITGSASNPIRPTAPAIIASIWRI